MRVLNFNIQQTRWFKCSWMHDIHICVCLQISFSQRTSLVHKLHGRYYLAHTYKLISLPGESPIQKKHFSALSPHFRTCTHTYIYIEGLSWYTYYKIFSCSVAANAACFIKIRLAAVKDMKYVFVSFSALNISSARGSSARRRKRSARERK